MISPTQRPLPDITQQSQRTDIHAYGEIRTHNPSKRPTSDPRLIPRSHRDRQQYTVTDILSNINNQTYILCDPHFTCWSLCNISSHTPLSLGSLVQTQFVAIFQSHSSSYLRAFHTIYPFEICMLFFCVCLKFLGKVQDGVPQTKRMENSSYWCIDMSGNTLVELNILDFYQ